VTGGFYSNSFDGTIKLANETWHIEPARKYGLNVSETGPSIMYNTLDVDLNKFNVNDAFRSKRFVVDDRTSSSSSFCGLDQDEKRATMREETERLSERDDDDDDDGRSDFRSRYTRAKRQTTKSDERERTCCYIYIRVDPTLWDVVFKNEGLHVSRRVRASRCSRLVELLGEGADYSRHRHVPLSDCHGSQRHLSFAKVRVEWRRSASVYPTHQTHPSTADVERDRRDTVRIVISDSNARRLRPEESQSEREQHLPFVFGLERLVDVAFGRELRRLLSRVHIRCT
jgi:hypothetical protein